MPTLDFFEGIKINVYFIEHVPPHIHAVYNEYEALLRIADAGIHKGWLPTKQLEKAREWLKANRIETLEIFLKLNPHLNNEKRNKKPAKDNKNKRR